MKAIAVMMAVLLGASVSAGAAEIYSPARGTLCDKIAGFCVDEDGISLGLTSKYLGERAYRQLDTRLSQVANVDLGAYTLSNGVHCDSYARQCYKDRFYPPTADKKAQELSQQIFGAAQHHP
jgi:hypothetical protein